MDIVRLTELFISPGKNGFPILIALIGAMSICLGYQLFMSGITDGGAALKVTFGDNNTFEMGKGGPGLIFSAFGMGIILFSIWKFSSLRAQSTINISTGIDQQEMGKPDKSGARG